jgi:hypothetical protein
VPPMRRILCSQKPGERVHINQHLHTYRGPGGIAYMLEDRAAMRALWPASADARFPLGYADEHMMAVRLVADRVEVHVRGVTFEPFGHGRTMLERAAGSWALRSRPLNFRSLRPNSQVDRPNRKLV